MDGVRIGVGIICLLLLCICAEAAFPPAKAKCKVQKYNGCYLSEHPCPKDCPYYCQVDCNACKPVCKCDYPGAVCQDPKFVGADGLTFYFHGKKDRDFCLLSDNNLHINAHFIGKTNPSMKRDFTWVKSIGILFGDHQLYVGAKKTAAWDDSVDRLVLVIDGESVFLPPGEGVERKSSIVPGLVFKRSSDANSVTIKLPGNFRITATVVPIKDIESRAHGYDISSDDCFAHLDLGFKFYSLSDDVNGVLGQTYAKNYTSRAKLGVPMPVLGGDREFSSSSLFATDCAVSRFGGADSGSVEEYASLKCVSGFSGRGVVCKR